MKAIFRETYGPPDVLHPLAMTTAATTTHFFRGVLQSVRVLYPELSHIDLFVQVPEVKIPVYFCLGRHDYEVPSVLSATYFEALKAPRKQLVWLNAPRIYRTSRRRTSSTSS
jgi:hypothetical protein